MTDENPTAIAEDIKDDAVATGIHSYRNKIKKRKKKFLANAKGFGKTGNFGRGTRLLGDEWSYFINIMDAIRQGFDSLDDKSKCVSSGYNVIFFIFVFVSQCQWQPVFLNKRKRKKYTLLQTKLHVLFWNI